MLKNENNDNRQILTPDRALELWRSGKDKWNTWVEKNPNYDVSFERLKFEPMIDQKNISFDGFCFPNGIVSFDYAEFGAQNVSFKNTDFANGEVSFKHTKFGSGNITFDEANFNDCEICFNHSTFNGKFFSFRNAVFGKGDLQFYGVNFGTSVVYFNVISFGQGKVLFNGISCHTLDFEWVESEKVPISPALEVAAFSLRKATIRGPLTLNNLKFNCIPDLRSTQISHHVDMDGLQIMSKRERGPWYKAFYKYAPEKTSQSRVRRLKEIAEQFKHHHEALYFNALENRAARWTHQKSFILNTLDMLYSGISDYGQSIVKPIYILFITWLIFAIFYVVMAETISLSFSSFGHMFGLAVVNSLPFVPIGKTFQNVVIEQYGLTIINGMFVMMTLQSVRSLILIFLVGLGLRNHFRL